MRRVFSCLALLVLPILAAAQEPSTPQETPRTPAKQRLKIGVALEGGSITSRAPVWAAWSEAFTRWE